jgi:hypothetical protein
MQRERVERLFAAGRAKKGLPLDKARRLLWMYTSREIFRMLVQEGGWSTDDYEAWLGRTLIEALVADAPKRPPSRGKGRPSTES